MRGNFLACLVLLVACGGAEDTPPGPLGRHFDDMYIAAIPLDQKKAVLDTQQGWSVGKMEQAKAESDFNESATQLEVARNELRSAKLTVDSAISQKKSADQSADT